MGVAVICRVYEQAPQIVAALAAIDGSLRMTRLSPTEAARRAAPYQLADYRDQIQRSVIAMFPRSGTERLRARVFEQMMRTPQHVLASTMQYSVDTNQPPWEPKKITVPLFVLNARSAAWTDEYQTYVRALSNNTEYRTFDGVGHFLMLEQPDQFNDALMGMLRKHNLLEKAQ
jgi:pimeloyl-ACP methyl ester carboxylesterase